MAPGGRQPYCMEKIKTQRLPAPKKAIKSLTQCVSASAAASGLLTSHQGTDAPTNLFGSWYSVRLQPRRRMQGADSKGGGNAPRLWWRLSSPILSSL